MSRSTRRQFSLGLAAVCWTGGRVAWAANGAPFESTVQVQGATLALNGSGSRYRLMFRVYDMALYLPRKANAVDAIINMDGPKRLAFVAQRDLPGTDLGVAFIKGLQANNTNDQVQRHTSSSTRLIEIFSGKPKLAAGDTFAMDFLPGKGTQFYIQGQPQGAPVGDAEFFSMILRIWLGPSAVELPLKEALLGNPPRSTY
ncbi:chalcone isomerase family protein [Ideonella sp. DXS29W]|uniref:Chalcone isomerase family protein n=1 Tax=Ideonella lacteola TaxID=2984193 RepID=A0ABU9BS25_9BURK